MSATSSNKPSSQIATFVLVPIGLLFIILVTPSGIDGQSLLGKILSQDSSEAHLDTESNSSNVANQEYSMRSMTGDNGSPTQVPASTSPEIRVAEDWLQKTGLPSINANQ